MSISLFENVQGDFFQNLSWWVNGRGETILEGDVGAAARFVGLSKRVVLEMIEEGEIEARQPGGNRRRSQGTDSAGRRRGYKYKVNMADVFRIAYGEEEAARRLAELGVKD